MEKSLQGLLTRDGLKFKSFDTGDAVKEDTMVPDTFECTVNKRRLFI